MKSIRVKKGSVKNIHIVREPSEGEMGDGFMEFRDDYSVFDYGVMPDTIPGKGESLFRLSAYNFTEVEKLGVKTHVTGIENNMIRVKLARVLYPQKGELHEGDSNCLVPLEVIFRNSLPAGSSIFKRVDRGEATWEQFGFSKAPKPGTRLEKPILDLSTKLEVTDRYLTWSQAADLARLSDNQVSEIKRITLKVNDFLNKKAASVGLFHEDGKIEFIIDDEGQLLVADVFGTLDENRFEYRGMEVSKQIMRDYYKKTPWYPQLEAAKKSKPKAEWPKPPSLAPGFSDIAGNIYKSFTQAWTGEDHWNSPPLTQALDDYKAFMASLK